MKKLEVGIIGAGGICKRVHLPSLAEIDNCEIVAICDRHEEKSKPLAEKYGIPKTYTNHHEMLANEDVDAVMRTTSTTATRARTLTLSMPSWRAVSLCVPSPTRQSPWI